MKIICKPVGAGKTTELIKLASENWYYIVCNSGSESARVARYAEELNLDIPYPITNNALINGNFRATGIKGFLIDNVEFLLGELARGVPVKAVSVTKE